MPSGVALRFNLSGADLPSPSDTLTLLRNGTRSGQGGFTRMPLSTPPSLSPTSSRPSSPFPSTSTSTSPTPSSPSSTSNRYSHKLIPSPSKSSPLPSLLRRNNARATASTASTSTLLPPTMARATSATSASASANSTRTAGNSPRIRRVQSTASVASSTTTDPVSGGSPLVEAATPEDVPPEPHEEQEPDEADEGDASDASSDFENLLQRVQGGQRRGRRRSLKGKEKERSSFATTPTPPSELNSSPQDNNTPNDNDNEHSTPTISIAVSTSLSLGNGGLLHEGSSHNHSEGEEDDEDDEPEIIGREEGQADPRDLLRAQLKRNESKGREGRSRGSTINAGTGAVEDTALRDLPPSTVSSLYSPRRYFILSTAGKLVFTTDEDEEEATGYVGVMQAIISIYADEGDRLRYVDAGDTKISFLLKAPLYLVCVSTWGEPESVLRNHLEYLYLQVLSVVTLTQLSSIFARRSNFDLRRLLEGTEAFFTTLTTTLQTSLPIMTSCLEVYRVDPAVREDVAKALTPGKVPDLLYALCIAHGRVVTLIRPKKHSVHPCDLHLLLSTISSSATFQTPDSESWIPICLPRFNSKGFLHAYISFLSEGVGIVLVSGDREGFFKVKEVGEMVKARLRKGKVGLVAKLERVKALQDYSIGELAVPGLRHFLYKSRSYVQVTFPAYEGDYKVDENKFRLITLYQRIHEAIHAKPASLGAPRPASKLVYLRTEHEAVLGYTSTQFELYLAVSPLLPKSAVVSAARAITRWVKAEEGKLFLTSAPHF